MPQTFTIAAALLGLTAVALGAFGAHGLRAHFAAFPDLRPTFDTATHYHLLHAVALLGVAWAADRWPGPLTQWAGILLILGVVLFSGSLYLLSVANLRFMGAVAPFGGVALLAGWACLGLAAWRGG